MQIDPKVVVELRTKRSWSQEELAVAAGLNLRTVQRIEKEGAISLQSKKALAAALEVEFSHLDYVSPKMITKYEYKTIVIKSDITWMSGWGKKESNGPFKVDEVLNEYGEQGWRVLNINHGTSVHGGAGQVMITFERTYEAAQA